MAINSEEKAAKARDLLAKLQSATDLMPEEAERTNANIDRLRASLGEYEKASRPVDEAGKLTADVTGYEQKEENLEDGGFFYEPSVDSVKKRLRSDPSLAQRLNLQSWTSSPDQIERLNERDTAYAAVADEDFKLADEQARQGKKKLTRYSKVQLSENPFQKALGFAGKHIPAALVGAAKAIAPIAPDGDEAHENWKQKALAASPTADMIGTFAGAASPASFGSLAANTAMKFGNYAARSPLGKAAISAVGGAIGSVGEGEMYAADQELSQEDPELQNYFDGIQERVTGNAVFGGALGAGGDLVAQGAKGISQSLRESPRFEDINKLRDAGGDTHLLRGVKVPPNVQENITSVSKPGSIGRPEDVAAAKIAPAIADSVDQQAQSAYRQAGESLENYHNSPQGLKAKRVTKPARVMLDMIREGQNVGDLGTVGDAVPKIARKLRERLMNEVERKEVSIDEYDRLKAQYGDDIIDLDPNDADQILGPSKQEQVQASVQPQVQPKTSVTQVDDLESELVNPFDPPAKNQSPEAFADTQPPPPAEANVREAGTVPPKGKKKKADGDIKKVDRDLIPTKPGLETTKVAMNEYGQKMYPYRDAMRGSNLRTEKLMDEFPYVENADPISIKPSEIESARTEFPDSPAPKSEVEDISSSEVEEIVSLSPSEKKIAEDSFNRSYEEGVAVPNEGNYTPEYVLDEIKKNGGVDGAARLNKGMRDMTKPMAAYKDAKNPQEATKIATSLEHPIELAIDNGSTILRDGRHRLEAAKRAGATEIKARVRVFRADGKAEEVGVINLPIGKQQSKSGSKTVLVPRARNSRQIEKIQQDIAEDLQGISKDSDWLKRVDRAFRETRDQFEPNEFTPGEMTLDDGTKVTGLSALQRKHHEMLENINEMKTDTSVNSRNAIHNKVRGFNTSGNYLSDQQMMEEAKKLGLEQQLREVAGSAVAPSLKERSWFTSPKGLTQGLVDAGLFRADALLRTIGNVPPNPFAAAPNTPSARIQQYLFENAAKNLLNFEGGRLGRFGNEVKDQTEKDK